MTRGFLVEHTSLDDLLINVKFIFGSSEDLLFYAVDGAETQHTHLILLSDSVSAVLSLQILKMEKSFQRVSTTIRLYFQPVS